ncbi:hypothetical protein GQ53DRAFT_748283 [Thozetella sp. PMI_491]|nr:hypothetical protein GQ53DRAFT_748283 [Thozetella sp. PMI_491]
MLKQRPFESWGCERGGQGWEGRSGGPSAHAPARRRLAIIPPDATRWFPHTMVEPQPQPFSVQQRQVESGTRLSACACGCVVCGATVRGCERISGRIWCGCLVGRVGALHPYHAPRAQEYTRPVETRAMSFRSEHCCALLSPMSRRPTTSVDVRLDLPSGTAREEAITSARFMSLVCWFRDDCSQTPAHPCLGLLHHGHRRWGTHEKGETCKGSSIDTTIQTFIQVRVSGPLLALREN